MKYRTATIWEQGGRKENEDSISLLNVKVGNKPMLIACIADGIGSLDHSEIASSMVTYAVKDAFEEIIRSKPDVTLKQIQKRIYRVLYTCHKDIRAKSMRLNIRMGTTCSVVCLVGNRGFFISIGDSRVYIMRRHAKSSRLVSRDDTRRGALNTCIGLGRYKRIRGKRFCLLRGDSVLICTDGFYKRQERDILSRNAYESEGQPDDWLKSQTEKVIKRGEKDNISAIVIRNEGR